MIPISVLQTDSLLEIGTPIHQRKIAVVSRASFEEHPRCGISLDTAGLRMNEYYIKLGSEEIEGHHVTRVQ